MKHKKRVLARNLSGDRWTVRFGDEIGVLAMVSVRSRQRVNGQRMLWLPEEAGARYCRQVHLRSGLDVARGSVAYYHNGRKERGRGNYYWSLTDDGLSEVKCLQFV